MSNKNFKINCSKLLLVMHTMSMFPTFAMTDADNQNVIENSVVSDEKLNSLDADKNNNLESQQITNNTESINSSESLSEEKVSSSSKNDTLNLNNVDSENKDTENINIDDSSNNTSNESNEENGKDNAVVFNKNSGAMLNNTMESKSEDTLDEDAALKSLGFYNTNTGELTEAFDPSKKEYIAIIKGTQTTFRIGNNSISTRSSKATMNIYFNNQLVYENISSSSDKTFTLVKGVTNIMKIVVTAENGNQDTYTVTFNREGYDDTTLREIKIGNASLTEDFNPLKKDYVAIVKEGQTSVNFNYIGYNIWAKDPYATLSVYLDDKLINEGNNWAFGKPTANAESLTLVKGAPNVLKVVVVAESGAEDTYTIDFERVGYNDTTLREIKFGNASLTEEFNPEKKDYVAIVNECQTSINVHHAVYNIWAKDPYATLRVYMDDVLIKEGNNWAFGKPTAHADSLPLTKGAPSILKVVVVAESGAEDTYTIDFERASYNDTTLREIKFGNASLTEEFNPLKKDYTAIVKEGQTSINLHYSAYNIWANDPYATLRVYLDDVLVREGNNWAFGKPTAHGDSLQLVKGAPNILKVVVVAESGVEDTYTIDFERAGFNDTTLREIKFGNASLTEEFNPDKKDYVATIKEGQTSVSLHYAAYNIWANDPFATLRVYLDDVLIKEGNNWAFGKPTAHAESLRLTEGAPNILKVVVVAESGAEDTYTIDFEREGFNDTTLSEIKFGNASLTEEFNPDKKDYVAIVNEGQTSVNFHYAAYNIWAKDPYAKLRVYFDGELIKEGNNWAFGNPTAHAESLPLVKGAPNILTIVVVAESGAEDTYTIKLKRAGCDDTTLSEIKFGNASLTEDFSPEKKDYACIVNEGQTSVSFHYSAYNIRATDPYATLKVYLNDTLIREGNSWAFGKPTAHSDSLPLIKGIPNILKVVVIAENGDKSTYTITFKREFDSNTSVKDLTVSKSSVDFSEGNYVSVSDSWQDIAVSQLILEDVWSSYKIVLNDDKEISVNEKFDLEIGDNKLDIEVTSNDGTKKTYPVIFERSDNVKPTVNSYVSDSNWTNEDVLINIDATDDSGIRYIELPNGEKVYSDKAEFYINKNGIYTFKIYDNFLNEYIETIEINNIDKELPSIDLKASTTELTNSSVDISIKASDNIAIKHIETPNGDLITKSSFDYTVCEDGTYYFKVVDHVGNEVVKSITLNNIDSASPVLATELSNDDWSNEELVLNVFAMSDKGIKYIELPDGSKVEDTVAEYEIKENGTYFIATESLGGNITTEKVVVNNIDTELPSIVLKPSTESWTNEDIKINASAKDNAGVDYIILPNGKTVYESDYSYTVDSVGNYEFTVVDLAGNKYTESIEIDNIDKNPPVVENYDDLVAVLNNIITLDLSTIETPSGIHKVILPNKDEIIDPKEDIIKYKVKYNDTYTFTVVDRAGNSIDVDVKVDTLIDKKGGSLLNSLPNTGGMHSVILFASIGLILSGTVAFFRRKK